MIHTLSGSNADLNTDGKILFIEDLDEYLYHVDRMMLNLKRSGKLSNLAGLVVGGMTIMNDNSIPFGKEAYDIIKEHVDEFDYPICFDFPAHSTQLHRRCQFASRRSRARPRPAIGQ